MDYITIENQIKSEFVTQNSRDVSLHHIHYLLTNVSRTDAISNIDDFIMNISKSIAIEKGIFEYSLVRSNTQNYDISIIPAIYYDKLHDILINLDDNYYLQNKTFKLAIKDNVLDPSQIAFLSPEQIHPENWAAVVSRMKFKEKTENTMRTTDFYKCPKCKERKCTLTELQMRCADEPMSKIITCLVCYTTFIK